MLLVGFTTIAIVVLCVVLHYEVLRLLSALLPVIHVRPRFKLVFVILGALVGHSIEIWVFGLGYYFLRSDANRLINISGRELSTTGLLDCVYYSAVSYTTLGFGDAVPIGHFRFLTAMEALSGLVLITWTASFAYLQMQRLWDEGYIWLSSFQERSHHRIDPGVKSHPAPDAEFLQRRAVQLRVLRAGCA